jgi:Kef-type K+ transport system membrane component KefB
MVPRGEVGMVVAQLGAGLGIVTKATYSVVVIMAVMTTVVAPVLLALTFRSLAQMPDDPDETPIRIE